MSSSAISSATSFEVLGTLAVSLALGAVACGNLDDVTTVKDLRVLAVQAEPAGFLVDLDHTDAVTSEQLQATITALVVDPQGAAQTLTFGGAGCPDYIDTITSATGKGSKLCPAQAATAALPDVLKTTPIPSSTAIPVPPSVIEYNPQVRFGFTPEQVKAFFVPPPSDPSMPLSPTAALFAQAVQYNRDFGLDAIVNLTFSLGAESATVIKRVVYWPLLGADRLPTPADPQCPGPQVANQNPKASAVELYRARNETTGDNEDPWTTEPTVSVLAKDKLYVKPTYDPAAAEFYLLRVRNAEKNLIETRCRHELLTFQFYATAGTFSPSSRQSELAPFLTSPDGKVHLDSEYNLPKEADRPPDGRVTIWVVVRDERAGTSWSSRTITVNP